MAEPQSTDRVGVVLTTKAPASCCQSRERAVAHGHYACYKFYRAGGPDAGHAVDLFPYLCHALRHGKEGFVRQLLVEEGVDALTFAKHCVWTYDPTSLNFQLRVAHAVDPGAYDPLSLDFQLRAARAIDLGAYDPPSLDFQLRVAHAVGPGAYDPLSLDFQLRAARAIDLAALCRHAAAARSVGCLRLLLRSGAPWEPFGLVFAARTNRRDILEVVLEHMCTAGSGARLVHMCTARSGARVVHMSTARSGAHLYSKEWCPKVPSIAAFFGHAGFLMRAFEAGCPGWTSAVDGEPCNVTGQSPVPWVLLPGEERPSELRDLCLMVSSDLLRSGPVLLCAARQRAPLTPRMEGMLGDVRRRALALAGCFDAATRLWRAGGPHAHEWESMGRVPVEIIQNIATLAKISIVARELVE